jgi:hypothetical protein
VVVVVVAVVVFLEEVELEVVCQEEEEVTEAVEGVMMVDLFFDSTCFLVKKSLLILEENFPANYISK